MTPEEMTPEEIAAYLRKAADMIESGQRTVYFYSNNADDTDWCESAEYARRFATPETPHNNEEWHPDVSHCEWGLLIPIERSALAERQPLIHHPSLDEYQTWEMIPWTEDHETRLRPVLCYECRQISFCDCEKEEMT